MSRISMLLKPIMHLLDRNYSRESRPVAHLGTSEVSHLEQNFQTFRNMPPEERRRVLEGLRKWRQLPRGVARRIAA